MGSYSLDVGLDGLEWFGVAPVVWSGLGLFWGGLRGFESGLGCFEWFGIVWISFGIVCSRLGWLGWFGWFGIVWGGLRGFRSGLVWF